MEDHAKHRVEESATVARSAEARRCTFPVATQARWPDECGRNSAERRKGFIALSGGMVTGLFTAGSSARRCPGSGPLPVSRASAIHPNPAWRPKQPSLRPPVPPTPHQTIPRTPPEPHRSTLDPDRGYYGEAPVALRWGYGDQRAVRDAVPPITPNLQRTYGRLQSAATAAGYLQLHRQRSGASRKSEPFAGLALLMGKVNGL